MKSERGTHEPGVFDTDAPKGYVGVVVYDSNGDLLLKIEISDRVYSTDFIAPLEDWARRHDPNRLRIVG